MVALLLILRDCGVAAKNTLFKHFLRSDRPQLSSACTKDQLSNVPSEIFNLKRNRPRNLHELICNFREQVARAGCKLLRANCQSKYQHCGGSLQSCAEKNIRFDCNYLLHSSWRPKRHCRRNPNDDFFRSEVQAFSVVLRSFLNKVIVSPHPHRGTGNE